MKGIDPILNKIILIIVIATLVSGTSSALVIALGNLSTSGLPLAGVIGGAGGLVALFIMVGVLKSTMSTAKK